MNRGDSMVIVLDDDPSILSSLDLFLTDSGYRVVSYSDPDAFFTAGLPSVPACLLLDNQLGGGKRGADVHAEMQRRGWAIPTVFITAHWSVPSVVRAIRAGADGFLTKPYDPPELLAAVEQALKEAALKYEEGKLVAEIRDRARQLSAREREVACLVMKGFLNKEIADQLSIALVTVKLHRAGAMRKLGAGNPAELARLATLAGLS